MAYSRRKQFEARLIAAEIGKLLAGEPVTTAGRTAPAATTAQRIVTASGRVAEFVPARAMLDEMGVKLDF